MYRIIYLLPQLELGIDGIVVLRPDLFQHTFLLSVVEKLLLVASSDNVLSQHCEQQIGSKACGINMVAGIRTAIYIEHHLGHVVGIVTILCLLRLDESISDCSALRGNHRHDDTTPTGRNGRQCTAWGVWCTMQLVWFHLTCCDL